jgi:hypothetical protein
MPDLQNVGLNTGFMPIATYTATYQINSGSAIAAGATVTDSATFTGALTTDTRFSICPRDALAVLIPTGLVLVSCTITATNTATIVWRNSTANSVTPPASATWTGLVLGMFYR